jgi:transposase
MAELTTNPTTGKMTCAGTSSGSSTGDVLGHLVAELEGGPVMIVGAFDVHRRQITFDWVDRETGEARRGQIAPATREVLRGWLGELSGGDGHFAVEGCTGWRFVAEELGAAGLTAHLAEPADTATLRGRKRRAKTDRADARHLRELLEQDRLPESWIPPAHILDLRELVRLRKTLIDQRTQWKQRIHAVLFHHGLPTPPGALGTQASRVWLAGVGLPLPSRLLVDVGVAEIDTATHRLEPICGWLRAYARRQPGCRALLRELFGIGPLCATTILAELGDARRFAGGDAVVRYAGLDITVWSSDTKRSPGHLARQGPEVLRWALFEAAKSSARRTAPDHAYYAQVKDRLTANRATLSTARKLARHARHVLVELGEQALAPVGPDQLPPLLPAPLPEAA